MAYIIDKEGNQQVQGAGYIPQTTSGSSVVGNNVSTAGTGPGGQGGWTNIQAYLDANKGNNTTAGALQNEVGAKFEQEQSKIQEDTSKVKSQADQAFSQYYKSPTDAKTGVGSQEWLDSSKSFLNNQYAGPQSYAYGMSADVQNFGNQLQQNNFGGLLNYLYDKSAGGQMTSGQRALQNQLDVNNPGLEQARMSLQDRYNALNNYWQNQVSGTDQYLKDLGNRYQTDQGLYRQGLQDYATELQSEIDRKTAYYNSPGYDKVGDPSKTLEEFLGSTYQDLNAVNDVLGVAPMPEQNAPSYAGADKGIAGGSQPKGDFIRLPKQPTTPQSEPVQLRPRRVRGYKGA